MVSIQICHLSQLVPSKVSWNALKQDHENLQRTAQKTVECRDVQDKKNKQSFCGPGAAVNVNKFPDLKPMLSICMTWENSRSQSCHVFHLKSIGKVLWIPFQNDLHRNNGTHTTSKDHHDWCLSCVLNLVYLSLIMHCLSLLQIFTTELPQPPKS